MLCTPQDSRVPTLKECLDPGMAASEADQAEQWVSWVRAAELLGRHESTIRLYVAQGRLSSRPRQGARPSVHLPSVHALAAQLRSERRARAVRAARRAKRRHPPDSEHVWLTASTAALVLGVTRNRVDQRAVAGTLPFTAHNGRRWFRRDLIEQAAAARSFRARQSTT